jgi:hypothetical protein
MKTKESPYQKKYLNQLISSNHFPLVNAINLHDLNTNSINNALTKKIQSISLIPPDYPKFRNIKPATIINLRLALYLEEYKDEVDNCCLNLLRYIEVNLSKLKKNEKLYGRSRRESILIFQQLKALFVEYHINNCDLLYLNTALKIADLKWIKPVNSTPNSVKELDIIKNRQVEYILNQLENE